MNLSKGQSCAARHKMSVENSRRLIFRAVGTEHDMSISFLIDMFCTYGTKTIIAFIIILPTYCP